MGTRGGFAKTARSGLRIRIEARQKPDEWAKAKAKARAKAKAQSQTHNAKMADSLVQIRLHVGIYTSPLLWIS
jgi:hypothetical protein